MHGWKEVACRISHSVPEAVQNKMNPNIFSISLQPTFLAISSYPTKIRDIAGSLFPKYPTVSCPSLSPGTLLQCPDEFSPFFPME